MFGFSEGKRIILLFLILFNILVLFFAPFRRYVWKWFPKENLYNFSWCGAYGPRDSQTNLYLYVSEFHLCCTLLAIAITQETPYVVKSITYS